MKKKILLWGTLATVAIGAFGFFAGAGSTPVKARKGVELTTTPQTLPFSQNWGTTTLITTDDDWSGVPGIVGYQGTDLFTTIGGDLSTVVADGSGTVDVFANQTNPDTFISGGVAEFDTIANPVVAMQGSGTADVPHIVIYLNTTGNTNINFACNLRDIDNSVDNSAQQINIQYRVGGTGDYTNVPGGYFADASAGPSATLTTPVSLALPAAVNNQPLVEIRVATINATGSDEWIGIDDISVTGTAGPSGPVQNHVDFNGDGKTDFATVRNTGGGNNGQITWYVAENSVAGTITYKEWGLATDFFVPEDYDGDNKTDFAVWRPGAPGVAAWYIFQSQTNTVRAELFGQTGDEPRVVGDYDGDGKADLVVYRSGANLGDQSTWFYRTTAGGPVFGRVWGQNGDFPAPGDYDGDGKRDFGIQRNDGAGRAAFWFNYAAAAPGVLSRFVRFGTPTDVVVPGDYDGDGKTDVATVRGSAGVYNWFYEPSTAPGTFLGVPFGASATDYFTQGDYDGDGKTDFAVWRPSATIGASAFYYRRSSDGGFGYKNWSQNGDYPVANYNRF